jgi:hypothetical protein
MCAWPQLYWAYVPIWSEVTRRNKKMPMKTKPKQALVSRATRQIRRELLTPVMALLHKSGIPKPKLLAECKAAIRSASSSKLRIVHISIGQEVTGIVNRWLRDPNYLNGSGRPDELPLKGKRSIGTLVRACETTVSPKAALELMVRFGVVKRIPSGKYRLIRRLMDYGHPVYLPFEPNFKFLTDAARVSTRRLRNSTRPAGLFWQCADNPRIDSRKVREFMEFAQRRSLSFMHEINDWLDEHECTASRPAKGSVKLKRLGVGLFGICQ